MDDYSILIGAAPTKEEIQKMTANSLRRRRSFGELGQITGDKVLAPMGQNMSKQADQYAEQIQRTRQMDTDNAQTKSYQDSQIAHMANALAETKRGNNLDYSAQMAAIRQREMDSQLDFMKGGAGADYRKMTDGTRNKVLSSADTLAAFGSQKSSFNPLYAQKLGPGPQSRLPNAMAQVGVGTEGSKEAAQWWGQWSQLYTLPVRKELFGATLTPNEQAAWKAADINPSMSEKQINDRIDALMTAAGKSAVRRGRTMVVEGFDPEIFKQAYTDTLPDVDFGETTRPRGGGGSSRTRIERSSSDEPQYSDAEIQERLRRIDEALAEGGTEP